MRSTIFKIVLATNVVALAILFFTWWANGRDDTWYYATAALIVLSSFLYLRSPQKDENL